MAKTKKLPEWLETLDIYVQIMKGAHRDNEDPRHFAIAALPVIGTMACVANEARLRLLDESQLVNEPSEGSTTEHGE